MRVTYLGHSGFLAETEKAYYLFDYIRGDLPEFMAGKPLYVFASHAHGDHFSEQIFYKKLVHKVEKYILSSDILDAAEGENPDWIADF